MTDDLNLAGAGAEQAPAPGPTPPSAPAASTPTTPAATASAAPTAPTAPTPPFPASGVTPTPDSAPIPPVDVTKRPHPAQFGTIVWGMLLLALCGFVALAQFGPGIDADRYLWAFVGVIAAGVALVVVGIAAAFRR
ncbi:hypothetical protein [Herbiconiux ginsengi]|uniref:Uncharacterized protein n=1 Tax=Herbiconiux ginsengi TaxID=381665 RepID=A0A1H3KU07_9MICO|nr:hypothetical protein [Herbiconiux ginsengi]SDY55228.1 hypothetical protein SAMN05216554_0683 [Herbiconiux ginsengi]